MRRHFVKMHGLGNDFVVFDATREPLQLDAPTVRRIADRHFGVGCDQVLVVAPADAPGADFRYRIFNSDGAEVEQCGNGARCFARFVHDARLSRRNPLTVDTLGGRLVLHLLPDGQVSVNMGVPRFETSATSLGGEQQRAEYALDVQGFGEVRFGAVSMGNPHAVVRVDEVAAAPVERLGPLLQRHAFFPAGVNVGFLQVVDAHHARLRVFERGAGETLACGSGACAAAVVGMERGWLGSPVEVCLPGGCLHIEWPGRGEAVRMTGPAVRVFSGELESGVLASAVGTMSCGSAAVAKGVR